MELDRETRVCEPRLTECLVEDLDGAVEPLHQGAKLRQSAGTGLNQVSGRSHPPLRDPFSSP